MTRRAYLPGVLPEEVDAPAAPEQLGLSIVPTMDRSKSQWFTRPTLGESLLDLVGPWLSDMRQRDVSIRVLEPSAGQGTLVRILRRRVPQATIDAVEIDARWGPMLSEAGASSVSICDYLERPAPAKRYDLITANPPFTAGVEADHVGKMLDEGERIALILPTRGLHGRDRWSSIWKRMGRDWWLRQQKNLIARPAFGADGGSDEYVLLDLRRTPGSCEVSWL